MTETAAAQPKDLATIDRESLTNSAGVPYREFRASLTPKYGIVWRDIAIAYLALCACAVGIVAIGAKMPLLAVIVGAPVLGYTVASLHLFIHEAGHYNIAADRKLNDVLANLLIGVLIGLDVRDYRPVHFGHHRYLGEPNDPEHSYFNALNAQFLIGGLTGFHAIRVLLQKIRAPHPQATEQESGRTHPGVTLAGVALHACVLVSLLVAGLWPLAVAWGAGMVVFFPFFASVRQVLEHRDEDADPSIAYDTIPHGAVNRLFGSGPLASTFGSAGFNRHLLHHLEPQISYTRLAELEAYLRDTQYAPILEARTTTYTKTLRRLLAT